MSDVSQENNFCSFSKELIFLQKYIFFIDQKKIFIGHDVPFYLILKIFSWRINKYMKLSVPYGKCCYSCSDH